MRIRKTISFKKGVLNYINKKRGLKPISTYINDLIEKRLERVK